MKLTDRKIRSLSHDQQLLFYEKLAHLLAWSMQVATLGPSNVTPAKRFENIEELAELIKAVASRTIILRLKLWEVRDHMAMFKQSLQDRPGLRRHVEPALDWAYKYVTGAKAPIPDWVTMPQIPEEMMAEIRAERRPRTNASKQ